MTPIFLFSLPRSGSTLLQSILSRHDEITTSAEPWILLPLLSARKNDHLVADHDQSVLLDALNDFCAALPNGDADYAQAVRDFALGLYGKIGDTAYFLDKTPRYSLIAPEIIETFPDAKFVFLWRNPLAIMVSMIETWGQGRWNLFRYYADIFKGLQLLLQARRALGDRAVDIRFEDLLTGPEPQLARVSDYLGLEIGVDDLGQKNKVLSQARLGDPGFGEKFHGLSVRPVDAWQSSVNNPLRRVWMRRYLRQLGGESLGLMGYDLDVLLAELDQTKGGCKHLFSDAGLMIYGWVFRWLNLPGLRKKAMGRRPVLVQK